MSTDPAREIARLPDYERRKVALEKAIASRLGGDMRHRTVLATVQTADRFIALEKLVADSATAPAAKWANRWKRT
jgi:hypothetical protein